MALINPNKINWFPGHMKKATDEIKNKIKQIDFFIQVLDARAIKTSANPDLQTWINGKPLINIVLKSDLASNIISDENYLIGNLKNKQFRETIINHLYNMFTASMEKLKRKGLINPEFTGMVVGLPNIGKSSLINFLAKKNQLKTENRPGVTKTQATKSINQHFKLIDTPGIFIKNIENENDAYKLIMINCIRKEVVDLMYPLSYVYEHYVKHHWDMLKNFYKLDQPMDFHAFVDHICATYQFYMAQKEFDYTRAYNLLYEHFANQKICRVNYDIL
ncbi:ribosome biogenesis GTPase YlqF [Ureaplasma zalophigenitalium]|uniref:Ribosome biogenesis GTPase A n=1 Tax=Ureaplasma zalophigenitalium TaxID=907723 RepID=A0ABT3BQ00_9BACT|nr:ribosome biogenesis GTPase YlqF [Ureaplasma zalophigenitalium]MCV3754306.1 ribosome biogenesis GTPase YlqF [Ureaplasma zalophigenitalium]